MHLLHVMVDAPDFRKRLQNRKKGDFYFPNNLFYVLLSNMLIFLWNLKFFDF